MAAKSRLSKAQQAFAAAGKKTEKHYAKISRKDEDESQIIDKSQYIYISLWCIWSSFYDNNN